MKIQRVPFGQNIAWHSIAILIVLPALCSKSIAYDGAQFQTFDSCGSEGCQSGCGTEFLTGPTQGSIYQPCEPPLQDDSSDLIQQSMPNENPSSTAPAQDYSAPFNQPQVSAASPSLFSGGVEGTLAAQGHTPGYINWAIPRSQFRMRFDAGFNNERPDRAEFFYAQCGCSPGAPGPGTPGPPPTVNRSVDYQDLRGYLEIATSSRFSVFGEVPVRFLQTTGASNLGPDVRGTGDTAGFADLEAGFKYALIRDADSIFTFQLKGYIPTGDASHGLGTNHVSLEPGFLAQRRINSRLDVFGEFLDWIPINGSTLNGQNYAGNVLRYGVGAAYTVAETHRVKFSPIAEVVGWSVLDGQVLNASGAGAAVEDAATTIVNLKVGVRTMFKSNGSTLYLGYGHALTGQKWYEDLARIEYTIFL